MTPAKKKTPQLPRSQLTKRTMNIGFRTLDELYGDPNNVNITSLDPLAEMEREDDRDAVRELRELRATRRRVEFRQKIEAEKQKLGAVDVAGGALGIKGLYNFTPQEMQQISRMTEPEQEAFYATLQRITTMAAMMPQGGVGGQGMNPLFSLMLSGGFNPRGQQGLGIKDITEIGRMYETIFKGAGGGDKSLTNTLLLELMTKTVPGLQLRSDQNLHQMYQTQIAQLRETQSDPIRDMKYFQELAPMMGYGSKSQSESVAMATLEMQDRWKRTEWEFKTKELADRKMIGMIDKILERVNIPKMVQAATRQQTREMFTPQQPVLPPVDPNAQVLNPQEPLPGFSQKAPMNPQGPPMGAPPVGGGRTVIYACQGCGAQMAAPEGVPTVTCTACGKVHQTTYSQT